MSAVRVAELYVLRRRIHCLEMYSVFIVVNVAIRITKRPAFERLGSIILVQVNGERD
jgi:hypothetical protein